MLKQFSTFAVACSIACAGAGAAQAAPPVYGFVVKNTYPHDPGAFTQGLFYRDGYLYESTGQYGRSTIRKVELKTGKVLQKADLPAEVFGEGSTAVGNNLIGLTWTSQVGYVFDLKTFKLKQSFKYEGEGWGLASDAKHLYMSDGSSFIRILDPHTMKELRRVQVMAEGRPVERLNELEMVDGELYSNIWGSELIARIDPASGKVLGVIDLTGLLPREQRGTTEVDAVLNGIAWDSKGKRLFVTGKLWPKLFEIALVPKLRK
ncbi:glutaminyl-peptide cyclotransferase [Massilia sp. HP4]|uniref:glutaminyl-peptide cyclotransferase n=1 Tax=Massilia sp. HP4 TaxID=2562316 RepID=UPI0010C0F56E|nr:glutaminyl-peptide cyclotransferase [Massilia sp. HP4]